MHRLFSSPLSNAFHFGKGRHWEFAGVFCLLAGLYFHETPHHPGLSAGLFGGFVCFFMGFFRKLRLYRIIKGTATSTVRSAAQGFAEITGTAYALSGPVMSPWSSTPCVWYLYILEELVSTRDGKRWEEVSRESTEHPIGICDKDGEVAILYPENMELRNLKSKTTRENGAINLFEGDYRHSEYLIKQGDPLFVNGDFRTVRLSGLNAGRLLLGKSSSPQEVKHAQTTLEQYMQDRCGLDSQAVKNEKVHLITFSESRRSGLLACGTEADLLQNSKLTLLGLGAVWLGLLGVLLYLNF